MKVVLAAVAFASIAAPALAADRVVKCSLSVKGIVYLDGPCKFSADKDGSFSVTASGTGWLPYFAYVNKNADGTAQGYWNETPASTHAHASLGMLTRHGACWSNEQAKICAY